ncbi:hypothetical protein ACU8OL_34765 (plasmid) [Rhizobium leguminosarum]
MSYVPKLKEEEALLLTLRILIDERKGQATVREIKELIEVSKPRPWSDQDAAGNALRSGAPMWHQIVQNACDRLDADRHFYRSSFMRIVSTSPHKILQITDEGRVFVKDLQDFENRLSGDGFKLCQYLDESPLEETWRDLKKLLTKNKITYERGNERDDLLRSLRSREYAMKHHLDYENANIHSKILDALKQRCDKPVTTSIDAWMVGRNHVGKLANLESRQESQFAELKSFCFAGDTDS